MVSVSFMVLYINEGRFSETSNLKTPRGDFFLFSNRNISWKRACVLSKQGLLVHSLQAHIYVPCWDMYDFTAQKGDTWLCSLLPRNSCPPGLITPASPDQGDVQEPPAHYGLVEVC